MITTIRQAAGIAGVTVATVQWWRSEGFLPDKPWTVEQIETVAAQRLSRRPRGVEHGTDECWRAGCSRPECRSAHRTAVERRRDALRERIFPASEQLRMLGLIEGGVDVSEAAEQVGVTGFVVWGRARKDAGFLVALDAALTSGRDPSLPHGTSVAYKRHKCKCPDCRSARRAHDCPTRDHTE